MNLAEEQLKLLVQKPMILFNVHQIALILIKIKTIANYFSRI
jgi:hypothetical protein